MSVPPKVASDPSKRVRSYARALTGSWAAANELCRYALQSIPRTAENETVPASYLEQLAAVGKVWKGPVGSAIEKAAQRGPKPAGAEQRRVLAMAPRVREAFLLTTIARLSNRDAAKAAGIAAAEITSLLVEARQAGTPEDASSVMIVEDEALIARDLEKLMTELGHKVIAKARTRADAVGQLANAKPDIILADMQLIDESSGVDAVNDIIDAIGELPVIFITAYPARLISSQRPGPTFLLNKPYDTADVKAAVTEILYFGIKSGRSLATETGDGPPLVCLDE